MPPAHRHGDPRFCGATTVVEGQGFVRVNGRLWAVEGDPCSHGGGPLLARYGAKNVRIKGKLVIVAPGDTASAPDGLLHAPDADAPASGSPNTTAYGK